MTRPTTHYILRAAIGLILATGIAHAEEPQPTRGAELLAPFKRDLKAALQAGMAESPVAAISACQLQAPAIAQALSRDGVRVGRASDRLRNPNNAAPDWVEPILNAYLKNPTDRAPKAVSLPNHKSGYVEPILLQPLCLNCHGSDLSADVSKQLEERYPDDRATGFEVDDLRGVFWVEYPAVK
jgi:hypothetical protein